MSLTVFPFRSATTSVSPGRKFSRKRITGGISLSNAGIFYGIRIYMIVTASGKSTEFVAAPGKDSDIAVFRQMRTDLPGGAVCHGDKIYNDYKREDMLREAAGIILSPIRKKNSVRATDSRTERLARQNTRRRVETAFSQITNFFPKKIHAVTPKGFLPKVISFIISFSFYCLNA
ncbi:transposase [Desulfonema magnum]